VLTVAVTFHTNWSMERLLKSVVITDCSHHPNKQLTAGPFCPDRVHTSCWRLSRDLFCRNMLLLFLIRPEKTQQTFISQLYWYLETKRVANKNYTS
jgi:hypothetical protein